MAAAGTSAVFTQECVCACVCVCVTEHTLTKNLPHSTTAIMFITQERQKVCGQVRGSLWSPFRVWYLKPTDKMDERAAQVCVCFFCPTIGPDKSSRRLQIPTVSVSLSEHHHIRSLCEWIPDSVVFNQQRMATRGPEDTGERSLKEDMLGPLRSGSFLEDTRVARPANSSKSAPTATVCLAY